VNRIIPANYFHATIEQFFAKSLRLGFITFVMLGVVACGDDDDPAELPVPTISLAATSDMITTNGTSELNWNVTEASSCTASNGWNGDKDAASGTERVGPLTVDTTFTLSCTGDGGTTEQSVVVSVGAAIPTILLTATPIVVTINGSTDLSWTVTEATSCTASGGWTGNKDAMSGNESVASLMVNTTFTLSCTGAGGVAEQSVSVSVVTPAPTIMLTATPDTLIASGSSDLSWTVGGATSCTASGGWTGSKNAVSGMERVDPLTVDTTFTLSCTGAGGVTEQSVTVTIGLTAPAIVLTATPDVITTNDSTELSWTVTGATSCTASDGWTGSKNTASGMETVGPLTMDTTFTLSCTGTGGMSEQSVVVTVSLPMPTVVLTATPDKVTINDSTDLSWTVTEATSCTASGGWAGSKNAVSGIETVGPLTVDTTFTLSCTGAGGMAEQSVTVTASPLSASISWDPNPSSQNVAGYKLYYGTTSRGCDSDPVDEQFIYSGPQADEGLSPIIIFAEDMEDPAKPTYQLNNLSTSLPAGEAYYFGLTAFNTAGESPYAFEVQFDDLAPPALCDVSAATNTAVILDFSEFVEVASSTAIANYTLVDENSTSININSVSYDNVSFKNVTLNTDSLTESVKYTLTVNNIKDFFDGNIMSETTQGFTYTNVPHIKNVTVLNGRDAVKVTFSEKTTNSSATLSDNYSLDNSLNVLRITTPLEDEKNVEIAVNAAFVEGVDYNITVNNVTDLFANTIPVDSIFSFSHAFDNITPLALSAHVTNPAKNNAKVYVAFSEEMDESRAENINNYTIDNGIVINSATLYADGQTVILSTSPHADGDYKITISNITDDSVNTNSMVTTDLMYKVENPSTIQTLSQFQSSTEKVKRMNLSNNMPVTPGELHVEN